MKYDITLIKNGTFKLVKRNNCGTDMDILLQNNNLDLKNYYIVKNTNKFRLLEISEIPNYGGVLCFPKDRYELKYVTDWLDFFIEYGLGNTRGFAFLNKLPPSEVLNKIKVSDGLCYKK